MSVEKLLQRAKKNQQELDQYSELQKKREERQKLIDDAKQIVTTSFYCSSCGKDYDATGYKIVRIDWTSSQQKIAFYKGKCLCGSWNIRHITDKDQDPYYRKSPILRLQSRQMARDLIQPNDPRFKRIYGDPYKKHYEELERKEREEFEKRRMSKP